MPAPIWTVGPSWPSASPVPIASTPPKNFTGIRISGGCGCSSRSTASTSGMPLPFAPGANLRTSQAANPVAVAEIPMMNAKPAISLPCAQSMKQDRRIQGPQLRVAADVRNDGPLLQQDFVRQKWLGPAQNDGGTEHHRRSAASEEHYSVLSWKRRLACRHEWHISVVLNHYAGPENIYKALKGEIPWTDPVFAQAIDVLKNWYQKGWFGKNYFSLTGHQQALLLAKGEAGMAPNGTGSTKRSAMEQFFARLDRRPIGAVAAE